MMHSIETDNKSRVRRDARGYEIRFGRVRLEISNWSDRQRKLRALVLLPDDRGNQHQGSDISDVPALRYREPKFSYEGHQERPELGDTSMNRMSVIIWMKISSTYANLQPMQFLGPVEKVSLASKADQIEFFLYSIQKVENLQVCVHS